MKPRFIRAFWGDLDHHNGHHRKEIENTSKGEDLNELVYVWGKENEKFIKSFGFETKLVSESPYEYGSKYFEESDTFFKHKLMAIKYGVESNKDGTIFLDWDMVQQKPIDSNFYNKLHSNFLVPLYSFPTDYKDIVLKEWKDISETDRKYLIKHHEVIEKYHWKFNNDYIVPNTSFVFCNDIKIIDEIIRINDEEQVDIISDETPVMWYFMNNKVSLEEYIKKHEPLVSDAKFETHFNQKSLNRYFSQVIKKDLYFIHQ
jgi:hypothetical protein